MDRYRRSRSRSKEADMKTNHRSRDSSKSDDKHRREKHSAKSKDRDSRRSRSPRRDKGKKHKKRHSSSSSTSSSSSSSAAGTLSKDFLEKLEKERQRSLMEKKKWKEQRKALETPEEKRRRRLLKKEAKERKRKEQMGWDSELLHYTNADNPFGDSNLLEKFVWKKKLVKEGKAEMSKEEIERELRLKQMANREELEKVKRRRQEREAEKAAREEEQSLMQRQREAEQFQEWEKNEDQFHLEQAKLRSLIRIQDGRAKPIDLLAKYINSEDDPESVEMNEPYFYLMGLTLADLEDLVADIQVYMELEKNTSNINYWNDLLVIVDEEARTLRKQQTQKSEYEAAMGRREGIHTAVVQEVTSIFKGKSTSQLLALQNNIERKIAARQEGVDISYWESLLSQLKAHIARARLRDRHQENLKKKLELLKAQQGLVAAQEGSSEEVEVKTEPKSDNEEPKTTVDEEEGMKEEPGTEREADEAQSDDDVNSNQAEQDMLEPCLTAYESGRYSPVYLPQVEPGQLVYTEEDDEHRLLFARARIQGRNGSSEFRVAASGTGEISTEERAMRSEAQKGMTADEAIFSVESNIDKPIYLWSDKYRPRKPRYFNRVHTGFEWNKYNQTHYDMDNPPPKIVQGYKFNIFYPDLIDKNCTPQYTVTPCADNRDFAILRFRAGPPYEDIAFKIVNREWEYSYKKGFRSQFHNNIMQLWFHFKRYRYRR